MGDIFQEVDEAVRQDRWQAVWSRYGNWIIASVVIVVLGTAGISYWNNLREERRLESSARFSEGLSLLEQQRYGESADVFAELSQDSGAGYALLAEFREAQAQAQSGDSAGAVATYDRIRADESVKDTYRDLAGLFAALQLMRSGSPDDAKARLEPLKGEGKPLSPLARELEAHILFQAGDTDAAREAFKALSDDVGAPSGVRSRAAEMVDAIEGGEAE